MKPSPAASVTSAPPPALAWSAASRGWLLGALGVLLFALTIPMTRLASGDLQQPQLPAAFVATGRAALAGVLAALWLAWQRAAWPTAAQWRGLALTASGVVFGFPLFLGWAVQRVDAAHAAVVSGLLPMATAAIGSLLLGQRGSRAFWAWAAAGLGLVLGFALWQGGARLQLADGLLVLAVALGGFGYVMGARMSAPAAGGQPGMAPQQVISWVLVGSLPLTLPLAGWTAPADAAAWQAVRPSAWLGFLYVAVVSMWLGFFAWYRGLQLGGMLRVSQVQLLQPFLSIAFAVPLLGDAFEPASALFALAVAATVAGAKRAA